MTGRARRPVTTSAWWAAAALVVVTVAVPGELEGASAASAVKSATALAVSGDGGLVASRAAQEFALNAAHPVASSAVGALSDTPAVEEWSGQVPFEAPAGTRRREAPAVAPVLNGTRQPDVAEGFVEGQSVQVDGSPTEIVYANPDGTTTSMVFTEPSVVLDPSTGEWKAFDGAPVIDAANPSRFVPTAAGAAVSVAARAADADLVSVGFDGGQVVSFRMDGAADVAGQVDGRKVVYREVMPGVDLHEFPLVDGVKEEVVLKLPPASPPVFRFQLQLSGVSPRVAMDGSIEFVDADGSTIGVAPPGVGWDSNPDVAEEQRRVDVPTVLVGGPGGWAIELRPDWAWLSDPATVYPVTLDPTIGVPSPNASGDAYVVNNVPYGVYDGAAQWSSSLGYYINQAGWSKPSASSAWNQYLSFYQFATPSLANCDLTTASFVVDPAYQRHFSETGVATHVANLLYDLYRVAGWWSPPSLTWAGQPAANYLYSLGGQGTGNWAPFDVTSTVAGWINGSIPNYGLRLDVNYWDGGHAAIIALEQGAFQPHLDLTCRPRAVPSGPSAFPGHRTAGTLVPFTWTDPAPGSLYTLQICTDAGFTLNCRYYYTPGLSYGVPANDLFQNTYLYWRVLRSDEATTNVPGPSTWVYFPNNKPASPTLNLAGPDGYVTTNTPSLTVSAVADLDGDPVQYFFRACDKPIDSATGYPTGWPVGSNCKDSISWISTPSWQASINWATKYYWMVKTWDGLPTDFNNAAGNSPVTATNPSTGPVWAIGGFPNGAPSGVVDTSSGNLQFKDVDIDPSTVGTEIGVVRSYNSLDSATRSFGKGWTFPLDMIVEKNFNESGQEVGVSVLLSDGRQEFHGKNPDGNYSLKAFGYANDLTFNSGTGEFALTDTSKSVYKFSNTDGATTPNTFEITSITTADGYQTTITGTPTVRVVRDGASGRQLTFTYTTPTFATRPHVTSVASDFVAVHGGPLTWSYTYSADQLDQACSPDIDPGAASKNLCTVYRYDTAEQKINRIDTPQLRNGSPTNSKIRFAVDYLNGRVSAQRNGVGDQWTYVYAATVAISVPNNETANGWPTSASSRTTVTDPLTNASNAYFDSQRRLIYQTDPAGGEQWFRWDSRGFHDRAIARLNSTEFAITAKVNDDRGRATQRTDPDGAVWNWTYNDSNMVLTEQNPFGAITTNTYDTNAAGTANQGVHLLTTTLPATADHAAPVIQYAYTNASTPAIDGTASDHPPLWLKASMIDARGKVTTFGYNKAGDLRRITDPVGFKTEYTYDELGRKLAEAIDYDGTLRTVATITYDAVSRPIQVDGPAITNQVTGEAHRQRQTTTYDDNGHPLTVTLSDIGGSANPDLARAVSYNYDDADREDRVTDAYSRTLTRVFDGAGRVWKVTDQRGTTLETIYNSRGLPIATKMLGFIDDPVTPGTPRDVTVSQTDYDLGGRPARKIDALGRVTTVAFDMMGRETQSNLYASATALANNPADPIQVLSMTTYDRGRVTMTARWGDIVSGAPSLVQRTEYTYDTLGRVKTETRRNQASNGVTSTATTDQVTTNTYDATDNVVKAVTTGGLTTAESRMQYDDANRVTITIQENGVTDIATAEQRDKRGLVTETTDARGVSLSPTDVPTLNSTYRMTMTYDVAGRQTTATSPAVDVTTVDRVAGTASTSAAQMLTATTGYTTFGEPRSARDTRNNVTTTGYDLLGRRDRITYPSYTPPAGGTAIVPSETFGYDEVGNLTTRADRRGEVTTWTFDKLNRVVKQQDPQVGANPAGVTRVTYDDVGNRKILVNQAGAETRWDYNELNRVITQTVKVRNGANPTTDHLTTYNYDFPGQVITECRPQVGAQTRCSSAMFAPFGQQLTGTAPLGQPSRFTYDGLDRPITTTDPVGRRVINNYDSFGRVLQTSQASSTYDTVTTERYSYDQVGNQTSVTRPEGGRTNYTYDTLGRLASVTQPITAGPTGWWRLNETAGTTAADATGATSGATYSGVNLNRPAAPSGGSGNTSAAEFTPASAGKVTVPDPSLNITDDLTIQAWVKSTDNGTWQMIATRMEYAGSWAITYEFRITPDGRLSFQQSTASMQYDSVESAGAITRGVWTLATVTRRNGTIALYLGGTTQTLRTANNAGPSTGYLGRAPSTPTFVTRIGARPDGYYFNGDLDEVVVYDRALTAAQVTSTPAVAQSLPPVSYAYDQAGNLTKNVDGRGNSWLATYNQWNLIQDRIEPSTSAHPTVTNRRYTTSYDAGGLATRSDFPGSLRINSVFDDLGRMISESSVSATNAPAATRTFTYDALGRVKTFSHPTSTATVAWDDRNLLTSITGPSTLASSSTYDAAGRMQTRTDAAGLTTYVWDANDRLDTETDPLTTQIRDYAWNDANQVQSVSYGTGAATRTYGYDSIGRLATDNLLAPGGATLRGVSYAYDRNSNVVTETVVGGAGAGTNSFSYDGSDRLTSWTNPAAWATNYTWDNNGNRLTAGATTYTYDQRNRLLTAGTETYVWTPRGTMKTKTAGGTTNYTFDGLGRMTAVGSLTFKYDSLNRITERKSATTDAFSYSGLDADPTKDGATATSNLIAHSPSGEPITLKVGTGIAAVIGQDRHGDLTTLFTPSGGALTDSIDYDPFGAPVARIGTTVNHIGFQTDFTDPTTALVNMGARWYAPSLDTFVSRDTYNGVLKAPVTLNRYTYAGDNPIGYFDPDGRCMVRIDGEYCVDKRGKPKKPPTQPKRATSRAGWIAGLSAKERGLMEARSSVARAEARLEQRAVERYTNPLSFLPLFPAPPAGATPEEVAVHKFMNGPYAPKNDDSLFDIYEDSPARFFLFDTTSCRKKLSGSCELEVVTALSPFKVIKPLKALRHADEAADVLKHTDEAAKVTQVFVQSKGSSKQLRKALENAGEKAPPSTDAHHIVAGGSAKAKEAKSQLTKFEIDVNSAENGVFLPSNKASPNPLSASVHASVHKDTYYAVVNEMLGQAATREEAIEQLGYIKQMLQAGEF